MQSIIDSNQGWPILQFFTFTSTPIYFLETIYDLQHFDENIQQVLIEIPSNIILFILHVDLSLTLGKKLFLKESFQDRSPQIFQIVKFSLENRFGSIIINGLYLPYVVCFIFKRYTTYAMFYFTFYSGRDSVVIKSRCNHHVYC